ncbi:MAG: c-type cytochrome [Deltaproteobacteria bacterium]|nr:MAG: c-type cytochrome [Deltaproteobacteria bacterium]
MSNDNKTENLILDDEKALVLDHDYDGIQELDHPLPSWWIATFVGTVVFGVLYAIYYLWAGGPTLSEEYKTDMKKISEAKAALAKQVDVFDAEIYAKTWNTAEGIAKGKEVYTENCMTCHEENGKGDIGPNLTDEYWLLAKGTPESIYAIVNKGNEDNGMPAWGEVISKDDMYAATAYVMSLYGFKHEGGAKEPQGEKIPKSE